jgi:hypothetical protein
VVKLIPYLPYPRTARRITAPANGRPLNTDIRRRALHELGSHRSPRPVFAMEPSAAVQGGRGGDCCVQAVPVRSGAHPGGRPFFPVPAFGAARRSTMPDLAKRCCQRRTAGRLTPERRAIAATSRRSVEARMIRARDTCFYGRLRSARIAAKRWRSAAETQAQTICAMARPWHR